MLRNELFLVPAGEPRRTYQFGSGPPGFRKSGKIFGGSTYINKETSQTIKSTEYQALSYSEKEKWISYKVIKVTSKLEVFEQKENEDVVLCSASNSSDTHNNIVVVGDFQFVSFTDDKDNQSAVTLWQFQSSPECKLNPLHQMKLPVGILGPPDRCFVNSTIFPVVAWDDSGSFFLGHVDHNKLQFLSGNFNEGRPNSISSRDNKGNNPITMCYRDNKNALQLCDYRLISQNTLDELDATLACFFFKGIAEIIKDYLNKDLDVSFISFFKNAKPVTEKCSEHKSEFKI